MRMKYGHWHGTIPILTREKHKYQNNECSMCPAMLKNKNPTRTAVCESVCVRMCIQKRRLRFTPNVNPKCYRELSTETGRSWREVFFWTLFSSRLFGFCFFNLQWTYSHFTVPKKKKVKTQNLLSKGRFSMAEHSHMTSEADAADAGSPKGSEIRTDRLGRTLADQ